MQLDRFSFDQYRLKCLDTESVKCRGTVEEYRVILDDVIKYIPYLCICPLDHESGLFCILSDLSFCQLSHDERLEEFKSHCLRKSALIELQIRSYYDYGTAGEVYSLTEEVLTESSLLTLEHVGEGFELTAAGTLNRSASSAVVDESIDGFLKHSLLVTDDDVRSSELAQLLKSVVSVDYSSVQVIEVGCCESASVELYHRSEFRRDYRNNVEDHPLRSVA